MAKQGFTTPKLHSYNGDLNKEWYVGFRHTCPTTGVRKAFQIRSGINYIDTIREREREGLAVAKIISQILERGWNPHVEKYEEFISRCENKVEEISLMPFNDALDFVLESKKPNLSHKSYLDIRGVKNFAKSAAYKLSYNNMPIGQTKRQHIKLLLDQIGKDRQEFYDQEYRLKTAAGKKVKCKKWSGNSYNKYRTFLQLLFNELVEFNALEYNPCDKISTKPEMETNLHRHATEKEKELIKATLFTQHRNFYIFVVAEYLTGIRPNELFGLRVADIDWFNQCFDIRPVEGGSKTRKARRVPIPNAMLKYLDMLNLERANPDDYIFSKDFKPGPKRSKREAATRLWKEVVKDGLGLNVSLYSFKGLGGEAKRRAGLSADVVSAQYGHSNMNMTMRYLHGEQDRINREIIERTPDF
jgi:integrase